MDREEMINRISTLTGETNKVLLNTLLDNAIDFVKAYTNREEIISSLEPTVRELSIVAYNRLGTEGETGRSEAGESYSFNDAPANVYTILNLYRKARV